VSPDLELALRLADTADAISLPRFRSGLTVETKADLTPVTEADRLVESELRRILGSERPNDAVLGEEGGLIGAGTRRWIVDPIDGTRNYSRGIPVWATLIRSRRTPSAVSAPALQAAGGPSAAGAFANGSQPRLGRRHGRGSSYLIENEVPALARRAWHARGLGDFWAHMLVAEGAVDGAVDAVGVSEWDLAAVQVIVEEAGGRFSDFAGDPRIDGGSGVSSNGLLHDELLTAVQGQTAPA
jgi:histidinol-phosphatase